MPVEGREQNSTFQLVEATIDQLHAAIRTGDTSCTAVVQEYIDRARAYNGVSSMLVTEDGAPVSENPGVVRAQGQIHFPTETIRASHVLPDLDKYQGPPLEFGRMESTGLRSAGFAAVRHDCRGSPTPANSMPWQH